MNGLAATAGQSSALGGNNYLRDALSRITRGQYRDYLNNYRRFEEEQIAYATDRSKPLTEGLNALSTVQGSFDRIGGQLERRNRRIGLQVPADQIQSEQRRTAITGGLASVTAANRAASQTYDRQNAIFAGG